MEIRSTSPTNYISNGNKGSMSNNLSKVDAKVESDDNTGRVRSGIEIKELERKGINISSGDEQVVKALERALKALQGPTTTFEVSVHKQTKAIMVKVLNKETGDLIREIPPEKTLDLVANMMEIAGIMVDEKV
ncbi:flagellar protein flag protein [Paenibacillus sp. FSL R7-269]|uniref:flagellar protein FlaG n=1 Tax=Paenibacillus sp. FSL R7-269 TaxID=1226755 RepID=UPI0003E27F98|nr:flagellar protein FlaG [Paenibacillus sp. FSL R7-269]ETT49976.1 flagellar protein flag protein [Paenibacillus sp. FSL R7-269]